MTDIHNRAQRERRDLARRYATDFETGAVHDAVRERLLEDEQLGQLFDAWARTDLAADKRARDVGQERFGDGVHDCAGVIRNAATKRAQEVVAEACEAVATSDGDAGNVEEAREWLSANTYAAERAGVAYGRALEPEADCR